MTGCDVTGYYTEGKAENATCVACETGASKCVNSTYSTACFSTHYLVGSKCVTIPTGSSSTAAPKTTAALSGFYVD